MNHTIQIRKALNGFVTEVGCKTLVFPDKDTLLAELSRYIDFPTKVELEYLKKYSPNDVRVRDRETVEVATDMGDSVPSVPSPC